MKSHTKIFLFTTFGYVTIKDSKYVKIISVNPLNLFSSKCTDTLKKLMEINI